jgi:hypothetical protein
VMQAFLIVFGYNQVQQRQWLHQGSPDGRLLAFQSFNYVGLKPELLRIDLYHRTCF